MWEKLKATGKPILLYGMGDGAEKIAAELKKREIPIAGVFASEGFTRGQEFMGCPVTGYRTARERYGEMVVLVCFGTPPAGGHGADREAGPGSRSCMPRMCRWRGRRSLPGNTRKPTGRSWSGYTDCWRMITPGKCCGDVVEYKLTGDIKLLRGCESEPREAWENILRPGKEEHYMDLGAYTGDTIAEFIGYVGEWRRITGAGAGSCDLCEAGTEYGGAA